jgi:hypothetical protein
VKLTINNTDGQPIFTIEDSGGGCAIVTAPRGRAGLGPDDVEALSVWLMVLSTSRPTAATPEGK